MTTGAVAQRISYGPFGETTYEIGDDNLHPFAYAGGMYDAATQLYRFGARDYDPRIGRWTAKDPIRWEGGQWNLYEYVGGDPVNGVDPSGLECDENGDPLGAPVPPQPDVYLPPGVPPIFGPEDMPACWEICSMNFAIAEASCLGMPTSPFEPPEPYLPTEPRTSGVVCLEKARQDLRDCRAECAAGQER